MFWIEQVGEHLWRHRKTLVGEHGYKGSVDIPNDDATVVARCVEAFSSSVRTSDSREKYCKNPAFDDKFISFAVCTHTLAYLWKNCVEGALDLIFFPQINSFDDIGRVKYPRIRSTFNYGRSYNTYTVNTQSSYSS